MNNDAYQIENLQIYIDNGDVESIKKMMEIHNLKIENGKFVPKDIKNGEYWIIFWNQRQQARKILLNNIQILSSIEYEFV